MRYRASGFFLDEPIAADGLRYYTAASVTIVKGDVLFDNGSGLATNACTSEFSESEALLGVAAADCASGGTVAVIPPLPQYHFWVVNGGSTVAATSDIGELIDLYASTPNKVDTSDTTITQGYWGFMVDEIDVSAAALAADGLAATAGGYVKGHFVKKATA